MSAGKPTILVCDDEAAIRSIVSSKLRGAGFDVLEGRNGLEAYCYVDHSVAGQDVQPRLPVPIVPTLVVTDLQMPMMSGLELAQRLREHPPTSHVPVLMLTARGYIIDSATFAKTNIRRLMAKPFGANQLIEQVRAILDEQSGGSTRALAA